MPKSLVVISRSDLGRIARLLLWINAYGLVWLIAAAATGAGPWVAWVCTTSATAIYLTRIRWAERDPLKNLAVFGVAAGLMALAADWWLISGPQGLLYADWGPFLARSPAYMPLSWAGLLLTIGFFGWLIGRRWGPLAAILAAGLLSGTLIPLFEVGAYHAGWWSYKGGSLVAFVPRSIILGEILIGLPLPWLVGRVVEGRRSIGWATHGVVAGVWIWLSYALGHLVVGWLGLNVFLG